MGGSELGDNLAALKLRADSGQQLLPCGELANLALYVAALLVFKDVKCKSGFEDVDRHGWLVGSGNPSAPGSQILAHP